MFCYCFEYSNVAYCILYIILCECSECVIDNGKSCIKGCTVHFFIFMDEPLDFYA